MTAISVAATIRDGAAALAATGVRHARREAIGLWVGLTGMTLGEVWLAESHPVAAADRHRFQAAVERRAGGEPAAYAAGTAAFRTLDLVVDHRVLIPRPETEGLVDGVLAWISKRGVGRRALRVADVGTGSGCIALNLAVECATVAEIVATDRSRPALAVAAMNRVRIGPRIPVSLVCGDLLTMVRRAGAFDVIVSNPPYLTAAEFDQLDLSVRGYEPRAALVGGVDGLAHLRALVRGAAACLVGGGLLALEVDSRRAGAVLALAEQLGGWGEVQVHDDVFGRPRYLFATRSEVL